MADEKCDEKKFTPFYRQLLAVSGVVMFMTGTGTNLAYPAILLQQLRLPDSAFHLGAEVESWFASILGLALIAGILTAPVCLQRLGRKLSNLLSTLPILGGWALLIAARGPTALLISRFMQGYGMGIQAASAPVTIAEYTSPKYRGAFLATIAFSFSAGMLAAHIFGTFLYWRPAALACTSFYIASLILISISPETPPYLATKGRYIQCRKSFHWLRGYDIDSERELDILIKTQKDIANQIPSTAPRLRVLMGIAKKPEFFKPALIMIFMFVLFQMSGMTVIPSYTVPIMDEVTNKSIDSNLSMLIVDIVRFLSAILACIVVNKYKRRAVLFTGITITSVSLLIAAMLLYLRDFGYLPPKYNWLPMVPTLVYILGQTLGILPIPWAIAGEIYPLSYRSLGSGISGMTLSLMFFVVVKTAPALISKIGLNGTFCVYAIGVVICGGVLYYLLPETKGKTLYEIECHFRGDTDERPTALSEKEEMLELENIESR